MPAVIPRCCLLLVAGLLAAAETPWLDPDRPLPPGLAARLGDLTPPALAHARQRLRALRIAAADATEIGIDPAGDIFYQCHALAAPAATEPLAAAGPTVAAAPAGPVPALHSRPGAARAIVLDFDGQVVRDTAWNSTAKIASWDALPYDTDGDPTAFSAAELTAIRRIWERVAEDFAPFDVDVTTVEPAGGCGPDAVRVLITRDSDAAGRACPSKGAGGVAYIGAFGASAYWQPAWVYANRLGNGRADYVAEAAAHEAGHTLGLRHDGTATSAYFAGGGSGETAWAPIMGVAYGASISQWCCGHYAGASNREDDIAIIAQRLGWRGDDHGATLDLGATTAITATGILGRRGDVDEIAFATGGGAVALRVDPFVADAYTRGGDLDLALTLVDGDGLVVATADPADRTGARLDLVLSAGRYRLRVAASGVAGLYDDYASLGAWTLTGSAQPLPTGDAVAPDAPGTLTLTTDGPGAVRATWIAPGDDGAAGTAARYQARWSTAPIADDAAWSAATPLSGLPTPAAAGTAEEAVLTGLPGGAPVHVALRAIDDAINAGPRAVAQAVAGDSLVAVGDAEVVAGGTGWIATFRVRLTPAPGVPVRVAYATADLTATAPGDYTAIAGTLHFGAGVAEMTVDVPVHRPAAAKSFRLVLSAPEAAVLSDSAADAVVPAEPPPGGGGGGTTTSVAGGGGGGGCGLGAGTALAFLALALGATFRRR